MSRTQLLRRRDLIFRQGEKEPFKAGLHSRLVCELDLDEGNCRPIYIKSEGPCHGRHDMVL
jgi:hypothetical protein